MAVTSAVAAVDAARHVPHATSLVGALEAYEVASPAPLIVARDGLTLEF